MTKLEVLLLFVITLLMVPYYYNWSDKKSWFKLGFFKIVDQDGTKWVNSKYNEITEKK